MPDHRLGGEGRLVLVGIVAGSSGPGWGVYACPVCVAVHGVVPAAEAPPGWLGEVRYARAAR